MEESTQSFAATVPEQPEAKPPLRKGTPVIIALVVIVGLIGIANGENPRMIEARLRGHLG